MDKPTASRYVPVHAPSDDYAESVAEFDIIDATDRRKVAGQARRTGVAVSPLSGQLHPVYELLVGWQRGDRIREPGLWVLDGRRLYEAESWRTAQGRLARI